ncbi:TRICHOME BIREFRINGENCE [Hibiscus trionum]|uniref:TRICHOME BIREFRINGENCE n=1 Tax=Hibiscus trionum TaxID=183268 RepID=A0A9W7GPD6_HIBTR|nr:TRICHOME BIREFRINGENCE [Hibiscus trionum]
MANIAKYAPINGGTTTIPAADFKNLSSIIKTRRIVAFFMFGFVGFFYFLAFPPSSNSSSPWVTNISFSRPSPTSSAYSFRSQSSSFFNYLFPNTSSSQQQWRPLNSISSSSSSNNNATQFPKPSEELHSGKNTNKTQSLNKKKRFPSWKNTTFGSPTGRINNTQSSVLHTNQSTVSPPPQAENKENSDKAHVFKSNQNATLSGKTPETGNQSTKSSPKSGSSNKLRSGKVQEGLGSITQKQGNGGGSGLPDKEGMENLINSLMNCDLFDGKWVKDDSYPLYKPGSCSFIDEQFSCVANGRADEGYEKLKWKPNGCTLPRLNGGHMLELLRGKRVVFVGDSLNRNMWESLICILRNAAIKPENVYEAKGRHNFRHEVSYSFVFKDYNFTVEFFVSPFLVREWEIPDKNRAKKQTLRLDLVGKSSDEYKSADILIFNTGHWWTHEKTAKGKDYYQEGSHVYNKLNVLEAFRKALTTWARWVDTSVNHTKTMVFFRGYSTSHFSGGQWNSGGACDSETEPIRNETYLRPYLPMMVVLERVLKGMKTHITYLNITRLTDFRKDGHPSIYRQDPTKKLTEEERVAPLKYQDCSHWCLPGVPDLWNELLYAELLVKENKMRQHERRAR